MQGKRSSLGRGVVKWREEGGGGEGCGKETLACEANTRREREGVSRKCNSELNNTIPDGGVAPRHLLRLD